MTKSFNQSEHNTRRQMLESKVKGELVVELSVSGTICVGKAIVDIGSRQLFLFLSQQKPNVEYSFHSNHLGVGQNVVKE